MTRSRQPRRAGRGIAGRAALALLAPLLLLAGLEAVFRVIRPDDGDARIHRRAMVEPDPDLLWRLIPYAEGEYATNPLGFRDRALDPAADRRVLVLGDSVSWGHGVPLESIYPILLEDRLNASGAGRVDVVNTGVPGYSTFQQLRLLERRGLRLRPDLVLLQFCLNDVVERYTTVAEFGGAGVFLGVDTRRAIPGLVGWLVRNSRAYAALAESVAARDRRRAEYRVQGLARDALGEPLESAWVTALAEIESIHALAGRHGVPLLIAIAPYRFQLADPDGSRQPQERLLAFARARGVPAVDLLPTFAAAMPATGSSLFLDASHFSAAGHTLAAEALVAPVQASLTEGGR